MPFDGITTYNIINELKNNLINGRINKIYQPESDELILNINSKGNKYNLLISASNNNPRMYLTQNKKSNPLSPPMFCMLLRKYVNNGVIADIKQHLMDRVIEIKILCKNELGDNVFRTIIIEIMGRHSNIILINNNDISIIDSIKRVGKNISSYREVLPGKTYKYPPGNKLNPLKIDFNLCKNLIDNNEKTKKISKFIVENFTGISPLMGREICYRSGVNEDLKIIDLSEKQKKYFITEFVDLFSNLDKNSLPTLYTNESETLIYDFSSIEIKYYNGYKKIRYDSLSKLLEDYYLLRDKLERIKQQSSSLTQKINNKLDRNYKKIDKMFLELENAESSEKYKLIGELITSQIYKIKKGDKKAKLLNYYDNSEFEIDLNPNLTPSENAQKYYKKYNKAKRAKEHLNKQIESTEDEIYYLESQIDNIRKCTETEELQEIKDEMSENGYFKMPKQESKKRKKQVSKPMLYVSSDGIEILVGKNNKQNDSMTLKSTNQNKMWLHTKDIPGSHVIINSHGETTEQTLYEAALLAAYYSKAKNSSNVPVDYTFVKYVKKPKGAKAGMVIYTNQKTFYVTPKEDEVLKIKKWKVES